MVNNKMSSTKRKFTKSTRTMLLTPANLDLPQIFYFAELLLLWRYCRLICLGYLRYILQIRVALDVDLDGVKFFVTSLACFSAAHAQKGLETGFAKLFATLYSGGYLLARTGRCQG